MKTYKVSFLNRGGITRVPNAQAIFGTICNIIAQIKGEEEIKKFLSSFEKEPMILNSAMFYENMFPMIKKNLISLSHINTMILKEPKEKQLLFLKTTKEYKKINYVSQDVFFKYIYPNEIANLSTNLMTDANGLIINNNVLKFTKENISYNQKRELITRVRVDNVNIESGDDRNLFYDTALYTKQNQEFYFLIKSNESEDYLKSIFMLFNYFPIGNRKSIGKNIFEFNSMTEFKYEKDSYRYKIMLSNCIPNSDEFDFKNSNYQIQNFISRTTNICANNQLLGKVAYLQEGSYMKTIEDKEFYGKLVPIEIEKKTIYLYGIGFTL